MKQSRNEGWSFWWSMGLLSVKGELYDLEWVHNNKASKQYLLHYCVPVLFLHVTMIIAVMSVEHFQGCYLHLHLQHHNQDTRCLSYEARSKYYSIVRHQKMMHVKMCENERDTFCYLTVQTAPCYVQSFSHKTGVSQTDRRTDGQTDGRTDRKTDGIAIASTSLAMRALRRVVKIAISRQKFDW